MKGRDVGVAVVLIDDGRPQFLRETIASVDKCFPWMSSDRRVLVNDSGDQDYARLLLADYPHIDRQIHHAHRRGLAGALRSGWMAALDFDCEFIFHCEGDFIFNCDIPIGHMADILDADPKLAQVSLKRQPVNAEEIAVGGFMQRDPGRYEYRNGYSRHRTVFSFNPCLIPPSVAEICLVEPGDGLERGFTDTLLDHGYEFGVYGTIDDIPLVTHIGETRSAGWKP